MKVTIATDEGVLLGQYSTDETYATLKDEDPTYDPTEEEIFNCMMDEVHDDAIIFHTQGRDK